MNDGMTSSHPHTLQENMISSGEQPIRVLDNGHLDMLLTLITSYNDMCSLEILYGIFTGEFVSFAPDIFPDPMKHLAGAEIDSNIFWILDEVSSR